MDLELQDNNLYKNDNIMIDINNVTKYFGEHKAVDIEHLIINDGDFVGLLGNNGAGKTTLFRLILDLLKADSGNVFIDGIDVTRTEDWKLFTGAFIDNSFLIDYLTPEEFFYFTGYAYNMSKSDVDERLKYFEHFMNGEILGTGKFIRNMSMGNKQKIGIVSAMLHFPKLLILDEPFNFLDPTSQLRIKEKLKEYNNDTNATIIISSHNLNHTIDVCSRIILLEHGLIIKNKYNTDMDYESELMDYFNIQ